MTHKVVIINTVALNGGDGAILDAVAESICRGLNIDRKDLLVHDRDHAVAARYYDDLTFAEPGFEIARSSYTGPLGTALTVLAMARLTAMAIWWRMTGKKLANSTRPSPQYLEQIANADAVVSTGGTMFVERYSLVPKFFEVLISWILNKPIFLYTQSFEKVRRLHNRLILKFVFRASRSIMVRGAESRAAVLDVGADPEKVHELADVVFRFKRDAPASPTSGLICISVRPWKYATDAEVEKYRREIASFVSTLVTRYNKRVMFISTCQGIPEYHINDAEEAARIAELLSEDVNKFVFVNGKYHTRQELMDVFSRSELVVATRLHACILALCAGSVVIPIAYEEKTFEVFGRVISAEGIMRYADVSATDLLRAATVAFESRSALQAKLDAGVKREQRDSMRADELLRVGQASA